MKYALITHRKKADTLDPCEYDIVLTSPSMYNYVLNRFPNYAWKRFIFDEPTQTKIPAMRQIIVGFSWFISATPNQLLYQSRNNQNYLSSLFSNCMDYNLFRHLIVKNDDNFVKESFDLPSIEHKYYECFQPVYQVVKNLISDHISQLIAAGDIEGAIHSLGGNATDSIIDLIESEKLELIKEADLKIVRAERRQDTERVEKWKTRRETLSCQLEELRKRFHDLILTDNCHICLDTKREPVMLTCCQNVFCGACVLKWLTNHVSCPICRRVITPQMMNYIIQTHTPEKSHMFSRKPTKCEKITDIIQSKNNGKFIIFSNFDETMVLIQNVLHDDCIEFTDISGSLTTRNRKIDDFKYGSTNVLFMNSMYNGAGINLQEATDIILYHKMSEDLETQIIGRAYRIGRVMPLTVHHLV
jgi:SNF2 family DNA or RNA helicase